MNKLTALTTWTGPELCPTHSVWVQKGSGEQPGGVPGEGEWARARQGMT